MNLEKRQVRLTFDTVKVTDDNKREIAEWCGGLVVASGDLLVPVDAARARYRIADADCLVVTANGRIFDVIPPERQADWVIGGVAETGFAEVTHVG